MTSEDQLSSWTAPSSTTEKDKQERTERMVREAMRAHAPFQHCSLSVYAKGSYPNNTNVIAESDVDIGVQCGDVVYWNEHTAGAHPPASSYTGIWTPAKLRSEVTAALKAKFPDQVDESGSMALKVSSSSARVNADVVPCFDYRYHFSSTNFRQGARIFRTNGSSLENYPEQQLTEGRSKSNATSDRYKKVVRILKRTACAMDGAGTYEAPASFFVESLVFNCPNSHFHATTWTQRVKTVLYYIWSELQGDVEPADNSERWLEASKCKYLFATHQGWTRADGRNFARAAWNYLGFAAE